LRPDRPREHPRWGDGDRAAPARDGGRRDTAVAKLVRLVVFAGVAVLYWTRVARGSPSRWARGRHHHAGLRGDQVAVRRWVGAALVTVVVRSSGGPRSRRSRHG
jgi:hypothetical protein